MAHGAAGRQLVQVRAKDRGEARLLAAGGLDIVAVRPLPGGDGERAELDLLVGPEEKRLLRRLGFRPRLITKEIEQVQAAALGAPLASSASLPPGFGAGAMGGYYTLAELDGLLDYYAANYPAVVGQKVVIGTSVEGRPIHALKVSDHPGLAENEPRVLFDALHHAREPMSAQVLIYLLHHLATLYGVDPAVTSLVDAREIWFVPVVNPDGYAFNESQFPAGGGMWRKNRALFGACAGVDLNRNYPTSFAADDLGSSPDPCSEIHRGPAPLSEPESRAMDAFAAATGFDVTVSLHAHGEILLYPLGYTEAPAANLALYHARGAELEASTGYLAGAIAEILVPVNGNSVDHHDLVYGAEAWAFEIGTAFWPPLDQMVPAAERNLEALLLLARSAGGRLEAASVLAADPAGDGDGHADPGESVSLIVQIENRGDLPSAPAAVGVASLSPDVTILSGPAPLPSIPAHGAAATAAGQLLAQVAPQAQPGARANLQVTIDHDGFREVRELALDLGTPRRILLDDLESDLGWAAGVPGDDAVTGKWKRADPLPVMQGQLLAQPGDDTTPAPGTHCFVTGNTGTVPGGDDVDDGRTTLLTPRFSLEGSVEPRLRYQRFYWCSKADDPLTIEISNDDGATFVPLEVVRGRPNAWRAMAWRVTEFVAPTAAMRLRFVAEDYLNTSVTEALIDDLEVADFGAAPHLVVFGAVAPGARVEVQLAGRALARAVLFASDGVGSLTLPGFQGSFGLSLPAAQIVADLTLPAGGFARLPVSVPSAPSLAGTSLYLQWAELSAAPGFSNVVEVAFPK